MLYQSITPSELAVRLENKEDFQLLDVREPIEYEIARIDGARLLPLSRFQEWIDELKPEDEIIVMCHHGIRSGQVCAFLVQNGFEKVWNLTGGIDFWSSEVDKNVSRY